MNSHDIVLRHARFAGEIRRYHTWPVLRQQTNGEHTWQCLRIYLEIWKRIPALTAKYLVYHDVGEQVLGDLPYPAKAHNPALKKEADKVEARGLAAMGVELPKLEKRERLRCKACDYLEMFEFGVLELQMGNKYAAPIINGMDRSLRELCEGMEKDDALRVSVYFEKMKRAFTEPVQLCAF